MKRLLALLAGSILCAPMLAPGPAVAGARSGIDGTVDVSCVGPGPTFTVGCGGGSSSLNNTANGAAPTLTEGATVGGYVDLFGATRNLLQGPTGVPFDPAVFGATSDPAYSGTGNGTMAQYLRYLATSNTPSPIVSNDISTGPATITTSGGTATLTGLTGESSVMLQVSAFPAGATWVVEYSRDSFATANTASYMSTTGIVSSSPTATGFYRYLGIPGYSQARLRRTDSNGGSLTVNLTATTGVDGTIVGSAIADNLNVKGNCAVTTAAPTYTTGTTNPTSCNTSGQTRVESSAVATTSGGATPWSEIVPANTTGISVKGSAGQVYDLTATNNGTSLAYVKLYDKATAPTCGTDTPVRRIMIPANGGFAVSFPVGLAFANGIGVCITGGIGDSDTTAPAANTYTAGMSYK